jgi:ubiquitin C-terminal hydrolase
MSSKDLPSPFSQELGYTGLVNLGNTCFLNSCLQVLNHIYELRTKIPNKRLPKPSVKKETAEEAMMSATACTSPTTEHEAERALFREWIELQDLMWTCNGIVAPNKFVEFVQQLAEYKGRDLFTGWAQNDLPEFLLFLIETFHMGIARTTKIRISGKEHTSTDRLAVECYRVLQQVYEKEYSEIMDLFYGIQVSEIAALDSRNHVHSIKPEPFFMLDLPMPPQLVRTRSDSINAQLKLSESVEFDTGVITLYDCLNLYVQPEVLTGDNEWYNEHTQQKETVLKRMLFWNFPPILVMTLKRFGGPHGMTKRTDPVKFPLENLVLEKYVAGYHKEKYVYDLCGVCNHMGGVMGGHYTAFVKNFKGEWLHCNDQLCEVIHPNRVEDIVVTPAAYCLFYRIRSGS